MPWDEHRFGRELYGMGQRDSRVVAETGLGTSQNLEVHPAEANRLQLLLDVSPKKIITGQKRALRLKHQGFWIRVS